MVEIKDSGKRREFETGAVRDIQEGKGRCDLMPLGVVAEILSQHEFDGFYLDYISDFIKTGNRKFLIRVLSEFIEFNYGLTDKSYLYAMLDVAKHFEDGAKKYGERNWEKGIPVHCYIDSAVRHLLKYMAGDKDEPHDRAFLWNIMCCIWTLDNKPEMNDMRKVETNEQD